MKKRILVVVLLLMLSAAFLAAVGSIDGRVQALSRRSLDKVKITIQGLDGQAWYTGADGTFSIPSPTGSQSIILVFEKEGFYAEKREVNVRGPSGHMEVFLVPQQQIRETVTVNAGRASMQLLETPGAANVIGEETLRFMPRGVGAEEALGTLPGIKIDNQANGERVHMSIRGQGILTERGIRSIQVLLDGIPLNDPTGFAPDLFDVDWATVQKIEVLRGPAASLYGGGAAGGIINIETRDGVPGPLSGNFQAYGDSNGFWKTMLEAGGGSETFDYRFSAARTMSDGYRDHTKFWANNLFGKVNWKASSRFQLKAVVMGTGFFNENAEGLNLGWLAQDRRMANPDAITFNEYQKTRRITGGVIGKLEISDNQSLRFSVYMRDTRWDESVPSSVQHRVYATPGSSLQYELRTGSGTVKNLLGVGMDLDWQHIDEHRHPNLGLAVEGTELLSEQQINQRRFGVYLLDRLQLSEQWAVLLNVRYDRMGNKLEDLRKANGLDLSGNVNFNKTTGKIGITWNPTPGLGFYAGWGQGFMPPATEELYANPDAQGGFNTHLMPATSHGFEFGVRGTAARRFAYDITIFNLETYNDFERYRIKTRPLETFYRNAGHSRRWGLETLLNWFPVDPLSISLAYTYSDFKYTDYTSMTYPGDLVGNRLPNSPVHQGVIDISYRIGRNWVIGVNEMLWSRAYVDATNKIWINGYGLLNARLAYTWQGRKFQGEIYVVGRNLANKEYIAFTEPDPDGNSYQPGPEREIFAGVQIRL
jgi:iron complex outermembrane receptor protein